MDQYTFGMIVAGVFGLMIGSFLNVLAWRLPRRESIVFPGSHCPGCGAAIRFYDNVPVLSYLLLRGRCRACGVSISPLYPGVELFTGLMFVRLYSLQGGASIHFLANIVFGSILVVAAITDYRHMIIPDRLTFPGMAIAALFSLRWGWFGVVRGILGVLTGLGVLIFMYLLGKLMFRREGVGWGDFKLAVVIGLFAGAYWTFVIFAIAVVIGGLWGVMQIAAGGFRRGQEVPFGPFISAAGLMVLMFREQIAWVILPLQGMFY